MVSSRDVVLTETLFQPIVEISSGRVVAHEALSRFADAAGAVSPDEAFEHARTSGTIDEVDAACIEQAVDTAQLMSGVDAHEIFVNIEPPTLWSERFPPGLTAGVPVTVEITERALGRNTGRLLSSLQRLRDLGHAIAVDDLGAEPATLALLPLIEPDVIKLDMALIRRRPDRHVARIMTAIADYSARHEVHVLAEGIEDQADELMATALGATLGQGWHYGRPQAASTAAPIATSSREREEFRAGIRRTAVASRPSGASPFEAVSAVVAPRRASRALLVQVSTFLEERARAGGDSTVVLATFQHDSNVSPATRRRYQRLVDSGCLLTVYTVGAGGSLPEAAHAEVIAADDVLAAEWDVIVLTADHAAALVAREVDPARHAEGVYDFVLTTDRLLVTRAARALLDRPYSAARPRG